MLQIDRFGQERGDLSKDNAAIPHVSGLWLRSNKYYHDPFSISKYYFKYFSTSLLRVIEGQLDKVEVQKEFEKNIWEKGKRVGSRLARGSESTLFFSL